MRELSFCEKISVNYSGELYNMIHLIAFMIISACSALEVSLIKTKDITYYNTFGQWVIALFSLMTGILFTFLYGWFRQFKMNNY